MPARSIIIKEKILALFDHYVESLLNICESEIEKQLFLLFLQYVFEDIYGNEKSLNPIRTVVAFEDWRFTSIKKIYDRIDCFGVQNFEIDEFLKRGYAFWENYLVKAIGVQFEDEPMFGSNSKVVYKLIPQHEIQLDKNLRLDFAFFGSQYSGNQLNKETKIAIECDGYEFHSTKEQLTNDNIKNRMLQLNGWKIYRMSGSEIFGVKSLKHVEEIFRDLRSLSHK